MANTVHTEELALFSLPGVNSGVEKVQFIDYYPISQSLDQGPVEFNLVGNSLQYIDLHRTKLHVKAKIEQSSGEKTSPDAQVTFINIPLHSMWSQVDISLQQQAVSTGVGANYPMRAHLHTLLHHGEDAKESRLTSALYYADSGDFDSTEASTGSNMGLVMRWSHTHGSKIVDMQGPLYHDLALQRRYILNGVTVSVKLWPSKDAFRLMSHHKDKTFKVSLVDVHLKVCKVNVSPAVLVSHNQVLNQTTAKIPYEQTHIKVFTIPSGQYSAAVDDLFQGSVPSKILVAMVSADAYSGNFQKNPFFLRHYNASYIAFHVDGESCPGQPLKMNFDADLFVEAYESIFTATGRDLTDLGNEISRDQYKNGNTLFGFSVDPAAANNLEYWPLPRKGHTRLEVKFAKALPESVNLIICASFPTVLELDASRNVIQS